MRHGVRRSLYVIAFAVVAVLGLVAVVVTKTVVSADAIHSSVTRAPDKIERAWSLPVASTFKGTIKPQSNASMCGPASLANVLRSFGDSSASESTVLAGTGRCWTGFCLMGLSLDELASLARLTTKRQVTVLRDITPADFHDHLKRTNDPSRRYIVNFSRREIFGAGVGHHSPIGGFLESEDLVLVLDVNATYQPWLIERDRLFAAMNTLDGGTRRGLLLIE